MLVFIFDIVEVGRDPIRCFANKVRSGISALLAVSGEEGWVVAEVKLSLTNELSKLLS